MVSPIGYGNYAMPFDLKGEVAPGMGYFRRDYRSVTIEGSDKPWLYTSGFKGLSRLEVPVDDPPDHRPPGIYTVRLGFSAPLTDRPGSRVFDVKIQGDTKLSRFDIMGTAGRARKAVIEEFEGIEARDLLLVELVPRAGDLSDGTAPLLNFMQVIREDVEHLSPWSPGSVHDFMHAKVTVADDRVFLGSFNLSHSGEQNAENVLEIADAELADRLAAQIDAWRELYAGSP